MGIVVAAILIVGPIVVRQTRKIRGPMDAGTAEVLSLRQFGSVAVNGPSRMICRLRLRVSILGREPYDVTVWKNIAPWDLGTVQPGSTVAVEVSTGNPKKVRLGRGRPSPQAGSASTHTVVNLPPTVTFNQSTWSPDAGWSGSPPPGDVADQIKAAVEGAFLGSVGQQAEAYRQVGGRGEVLSAEALLVTGQRVPAALKSFAPTGTTPRSLGRTPSRPELIDAPHYMLEVELHFPNLAPIIGRAVQPVPVAYVSSLAIGLPLTCAVDPADPSHRFAVDWEAARA